MSHCLQSAGKNHQTKTRARSIRLCLEENNNNNKKKHLDPPYVSPVLAPLSVTQRSALAERGSRDNCLRMLPLNQSEQIRAQDVYFTQLKIYLWRVRLATLGKLFKFSSRLTWRIGMSVACRHFH